MKLLNCTACSSNARRDSLPPLAVPSPAALAAAPAPAPAPAVAPVAWSAEEAGWAKDTPRAVVLAGRADWLPGAGLRAERSVRPLWRKVRAEEGGARRLLLLPLRALEAPLVVANVMVTSRAVRAEDGADVDGGGRGVKEAGWSALLVCSRRSRGTSMAPLRMGRVEPPAPRSAACVAPVMVTAARGGGRGACAANLSCTSACVPYSRACSAAAPPDTGATSSGARMCAPAWRWRWLWRDAIVFLLVVLGLLHFDCSLIAVSPRLHWADSISSSKQVNIQNIIVLLVL